MLLALIHNKQPQPVEAGAALSLKEDTLIASVFGRLRYVPGHCLTHIFQEIASRHGCPLLDADLGPFVRLHFWPRYMLDGRAYVEPDIVAEFDKAVILVQSTLDSGEAPSNAASWQQELHSLRLAAAYEKKMGKMVVLGGTQRGPKSEDIWRLSWRNFFHIVQAVLPRELEHERLLVEDLRSALELHGVETRTPVFFADFAPHCPRVRALAPQEYLQGALE